MTDDDEFLFVDDEEQAKSDYDVTSLEHPWKILIVDDEPSIHDVTRLALKGIRFQHREVRLLHAFSGQECIDILSEHSDIALILLDVVMETEHAGLDTVKAIRNGLGNQFVRIILRTGQPGQAPEHEVILNYDINDYKEKTELTEKKLFTSVISALRSFEDIVSLEKNRQGLEKIIDATAGVFREKNMEALFNGILMQVLSIARLNDDDFKKSTSSLMAVFEDLSEKNHIADMKIFSGTGRFESLSGELLKNVLTSEVIDSLHQVIARESNLYAGDQFIVYVRNGSVIFIETSKELDDIDKRLLDMFCSNISVAYENSECYRQKMRECA